MIPEAVRVVADLEEAEATSLDELVRRLDRIAEQLSAGMVDGRVLPARDLAAVRAALAAHVIDGVFARVSLQRAVTLADVARRRGLDEVARLAPALRAARDALERPPPVPDWPELDALRALPAELVELPPGITSRGFADELIEQGVPVPPELLELLAATDGLTLHNRDSGEVVLALSSAADMRVPVRDGTRTLTIGRWTPVPRPGFTRDEIELWLAGDDLTGACVRQHPGQKTVRTRFGRRRFDARDVLRFALARVEARAEHDAERELRIVPALAAELSWQWYLAGDDERFDLIVAARRPARARAYAEWMAARLLDDAAGDTRVGDHGAASKAERAAEDWLARARALDGL